MVGQTLSHYRIIEKIGEDGMGEVYRAEDTSLKREVAIKVLPDRFTEDPQRLARFEREAQLLASLNHPNIAAIYELEEADGVRFLSLELVEGETLAERVAKGPLPVEEALEVCRQIAEGVEAAHEKGVIHRDLKPANVKFTPEGKVKVLDFGLAKAFEEETAATDISQSPTLTAEMTRAGVILGTAAYMSPEQAKGKPVDKRADIFAFGAVLYELLTGKRAFEGETITETIAKVLESEPDWDKLPGDTPWRIRELLDDCLQKEAYDRLHDMANVRILIKKALKESATVSPIGVSSPMQPPLWKRVIPWSIAFVMAVIAGVVSWNTMQSDPQPSERLKRVSVNLSLDSPIQIETWRPAVAISPDGGRLVYVAPHSGKTQLYLRELDRAYAEPIVGTEEGYGPFFSPDGQWLGFFVDFQMKKVALPGRQPTVVTSVSPVTRDATWGPENTIIFTGNTNGGLSVVSANDKESVQQDLSGESWNSWTLFDVEKLTDVDRGKGEFSHRWSEFLPGGRAVLFTIDTGGGFDNANVAVLSLDTGQYDVLIRGGTNARYAQTGHIVYARSGSLYAAPFDVGSLKLTGPSVQVVEGVLTEPGGAVHFAMSREGSLLYVPGTPLVPSRKLVWVDRQGAIEPLQAEPREYMNPSISPDGRQIAVSIREGSNYDIHVVDAMRGTVTRLTSHPGEDFSPIWTPDSKSVTFASEMHDDLDRGPLPWMRSADAEFPARALEVGKLPFVPLLFPTSWSPDGHTVALESIQIENGRLSNGLSMFSPERDDKLRPFLVTEFEEMAAMFSPDGKWVAFVSNQSGRHEIFLKSADGSGGMHPVSVGGGHEPVWALDGRELFYRNGDEMMAVKIQTGARVRIDTPIRLFKKPLLPRGRSDAPRNYDVGRDGRFLMIQRENDLMPVEIILVLNWFEELKRLVPTD